MSLFVKTKRTSKFVYGASSFATRFRRGALLASTARMFGIFSSSAALAIAVLPSVANAQANIHNTSPSGTPIVLNTAQNTSTTSSGTLEDRGANSADTVDYNTANFDFDYSLSGTGAVWSGGVQYQNDSGDQQIWLQPSNVSFNLGSEARYGVRFSRCVAGLTFKRGGLDNNDTDIVTAFKDGVPVPLLSTYFDSFTGGVNIVSNNGTEVRLNGPGGGVTTENLSQYRFIAPSSVLIDEIRIRSAKSDARTTAVTSAFYGFDWDPFAISASSDSVTGINGVVGQPAVLDVLSNDDLGDPCSSGVETPSQTTVDVTVTPIGTLPAGLTLNNDGTVDVAPGTAAGTYTFNYQICEIANPTNCTTATATVGVTWPSVDLRLTKTNTPGVNGEVDQASDTVFSGATTTYTLVVTNNGPDSAIGALLTDTIGTGLSCPATNTVTITGNGVPVGSFTVADLTGAGITLGTLASGQSVTLSYSCSVN